MTLILTLSSVLGFCLALIRYLKWTAASTPLFVTSTIMLLLYIAALSNTLNTSAQLLLILGIGLLAWVLFSSWKTATSWLSSNDRSALLIFVVLCSLLWIKVHNGTLYMWDDFSHWGRAVKDLYYTDALPSVNSLVLFKDYPPLESLFQYFVVQTGDVYNAEYSEGVAIFAQGLLIISAIMPLIGISISKGNRFLIATILLITAVLFAYGPGLRSLNADHLLGTYFGISIVSYWLSARNPIDILRILPAIACIPLIKQIGLSLAAVVIVIIIVDQITRLIIDKKKTKKSLLQSVATIIFMVSVVACSYGSWKIHTQTIHAQETFNQGVQISASAAYRSLVGDASEQQQLIISSFVNKFKPVRLQSPTDGSMMFRPNRTSFTAFALIFLSIFAVYRIKKSSHRISSALLITSLAGGFILYSTAHLLLYIFFPAFGGPRLDSFDRYHSIYLLGWSLIVWMLLLNTSTQWSPKKNIESKLMVFLLIISWLFGGGAAARFLARPADNLKDGREIILPIAEKYSSIFSSGPKVYHITQGIERSLHYFISGYDAYPAQIISPLGFSIGRKKEPATRYITPQQWATELRNEYDYVLITYADDDFWSSYGELFDDINKSKKSTLFKVTKTLDVVLLTPVDDQKLTQSSPK